MDWFMRPCMSLKARAAGFSGTIPMPSSFDTAMSHLSSSSDADMSALCGSPPPRAIKSAPPIVCGVCDPFTADPVSVNIRIKRENSPSAVVDIEPIFNPSMVSFA